MPPSGFGATPDITPTMLNIRPRTPVPRGNIVNPTSHVEQSPRSWNPVRCSPHTPPLLPKPSPLEPVHAWSPRQPPSLHTSPHPRTAPRLLLPRRGHARKLASPLHFPHERGNHPTPLPSLPTFPPASPTPATSCASVCGSAPSHLPKPQATPHLRPTSHFVGTSIFPPIPPRYIRKKNFIFHAYPPPPSIIGSISELHRTLNIPEKVFFVLFHALHLFY